MYRHPCYCSDVCLSIRIPRLFFSRATHKSVRSLLYVYLSLTRSFTFSPFCSVCISRNEERRRHDRTVVYSERTRTEAPSDGVERWRLPGWFPPRIPLFGRLTLAPPPELHPHRAGHLLFSLRVLALFSPLLPRVSSSSMPARCVSSRARDAMFCLDNEAILACESRRPTSVISLYHDEYISRDHGRGREVIDFLSPSSVTRAHAH